MLRKASAQYARGFLHSEQDDGDLTYFVIHQLGIIQRAIADLHEYLERKAAESRRLRQALPAGSKRFNHRQIALLQHAIRHPGAQYTVTSHARSHRIVQQTARTDLQGLEQQGLLTRASAGRGFAWAPAPGLLDRVAAA